MAMSLRLVAVVALCLAACDDPRQGKSFYDREIAPILITSCAGNTSGCHAVGPDDPF